MGQVASLTDCLDAKMLKIKRRMSSTNLFKKEKVDVQTPPFGQLLAIRSGGVEALISF